MVYLFDGVLFDLCRFPPPPIECINLFLELFLIIDYNCNDIILNIMETLNFVNAQNRFNKMISDITKI